MQIRSAILRLAVAFGITVTLSQTLAATPIDDASYQSLAKEARDRLDVPIQLSLNVIAQLPPTSEQLAKIAQLESAVLQDLQGSILPSSVWRSGLGQLAVRASPQALEKLRKHPAVTRIQRDITRFYRLSVHDADDRLHRIEQALLAQGYADIVVIENLEHLKYSIQRDGSTLYDTSPAVADEIARRRPGFLSSLPQTAMPEGTRQSQTLKLLQPIAMSDPRLIVRVTRDGYFHLVEHPYVRALTLAGESPSWPSPQIDARAVRTASKDGTASVTIDLQRFPAYSPLMGKMPAEAWKSQQDTLANVFAEILDPVEPDWKKSARLLPGIASVVANLSSSAMNRLSSSADTRIMSVSLNVPTVTTALAESTAQINVQAAYAGGYRGAGQYIAIVDTGVLSSHPFLQKSGGGSKVSIEACYGTTGSADGFTYTSVCPAPTVNGDSGGLGAGAPFSSTVGGNYWHGTHVAGIAAGRGGPGGINGVAPDALIIAAQVFSAKSGTPGVATGDMAKALYDASTLGTQAITVNMSLSLELGLYDDTAICNSKSIPVRDSVALLASINIPVVAAAGNDGLPGKASFPACVTGVVKVGSVDDVTAQRSGFSNCPNPDLNAGPIFFAPGGATLSSSVPTSFHASGYSPQWGTSMASPHVAGVYALVKAEAPTYTVAQLTGWISSNATVPLSIPVDLFDPTNPANQRTVGRIVLPSLPPKPGF